MYSRTFFAAFDLFFQPWRARRLATAPLLGRLPQIPPGRPLILVANHTSWWDGFLLRDVQRALRPDAPFFAVMNADELRQRRWFRFLGALPLQPGSTASMLGLVRTVRRLAAERPDAVIAFFPQGAIWPSSRRPLGFRRGVELVMRAAAPCAVLPVGLHLEALNHAAPTAFAAAGPTFSYPAEPITAARLEAAVEERLDALRHILDSHGERAVQHLLESA
jgi:1-acyl-sn-glycerol-3-phosphate acyltransferase